MKNLWGIAICVAIMFGPYFGVGAALQAGIQVSHPTSTNYSYTLFNDEPTNSTLRVNAFHLVANAPFDVTSSASGWSYVTDNATYIDWFCTNSTLQVAPSLSM